MQNKKSFFTVGIIVLVLFLGVGYAVVSSVYLNIGGTASVTDSDLKVEITNAVASTSVTDKTVDFTHVLSNKNLTSNFTLNGMQLGETVTITYTVTNNEKDVDAQLALANGVTLSNSNEDYFNIDYQITDNVTDLKNNDKTMEVVVTVELVKTPVAETNSSTTVGLTLTASPKGGSTVSGSDESDVGTLAYNTWYINTDTGGRIAFSEDGIVFMGTDEYAPGWEYNIVIKDNKMYIQGIEEPIGEIVSDSEIIAPNVLSSEMTETITYIKDTSNENEITSYFKMEIIVGQNNIAYINNDKTIWLDFINSSRNNILVNNELEKAFIVINDYVYFNFDGCSPVMLNGERVKVNDNIINKAQYTWQEIESEVSHFDIKNVDTFKYIDGMTWELYISTSYNNMYESHEISTDSDGYVLYNGKKMYISGNQDTFVHKDDLIAETEYILTE